MTPTYDLHAIARVAADGILNCLLAGIAIALLAWVVARVSGREGSGTRFAVWFSALLAIALMPWVSFVGRTSSTIASGAAHGAVMLPSGLALYLFLVWTVGASLGLVRVGFGLYRLHRLRSTAVAVDPNQLDPTLRAGLSAIQAHRRVVLCVSDAVRVPAAIGYFRPLVVFPPWALEEISPAELNAILLHELAHLGRWDDWTNLAQKIMKAIFFFHPAVWFVESRLSLEREMACDDAVLAANFSPRAYAESLVGLAEKSFLRRGVQLAQAAVSQVQQLKLRIAEILRKDRQGSGRVWKPAVAMVAVAGMVSACSVARSPRLIAFSAGAPQVASASASAPAVAMDSEASLQPVKLSFVESGIQPRPVAHPTFTTRIRMIRQPWPKPLVARAQRIYRYQLVEDELPAPSMMNLQGERNTRAPSAVLVIMESAQLSVDGPVFWRVTVVHFTQVQQRIVTRGGRRMI